MTKITGYIAWVVSIGLILGLDYLLHSKISIGLYFIVAYIITSVIGSFIRDWYKAKQLKIRNKRIDDMIIRNRMREQFDQADRFYDNQRNKYNIDSTKYVQMISERERLNKSGGYDILGIEYDDSDDVIIATYRKLMSKYHPDKLESLNLRSELINRAKEKVQEYNKAYAKICKSRGIN